MQQLSEAFVDVLHAYVAFTVSDCQFLLVIISVRKIT